MPYLAYAYLGPVPTEMLSKQLDKTRKLQYKKEIGRGGRERERDTVAVPPARPIDSYVHIITCLSWNFMRVSRCGNRQVTYTYTYIYINVCKLLCMPSMRQSNSANVRVQGSQTVTMLAFLCNCQL